jgi:ABC-2 type transport system ATP-binding protein
MKTFLEVNNVVKQYATQRAVDDISFSIDKGTIFGLLGPNGAGKTTLIRMITGIFFPDSGTINFNGEKFVPEKHIIDIGYMPEERGLYKKMNIGEQAVFLAQLRGLNKKDAIREAKFWFEKLGMETWWNKKVEDLSKGMGQKLQFVTTVMHNPKLIILDEPFSGLDPVNANVIKDEIYGLAKNGATIIFSTHRMEQVEEICDQIILVNKGKKILEGSVKEAKQKFKTNSFDVSVQEGSPILGENHLYAVLDRRHNAYTIKIKDDVTINEVIGDLISNKVQLAGFNENLPSLNDIFIQLVEGTSTARQFVTA